MKVHLVTSKDGKNIYGCFKKKKRAISYIAGSSTVMLITLKVNKSKN